MLCPNDGAFDLQKLFGFMKLLGIFLISDWQKRAQMSVCDATPGFNKKAGYEE